MKQQHKHKHKHKEFGGFQFRFHDGEIYFSPKFKERYKKFLRIGKTIIAKNNLDIEPILNSFGYIYIWTPDFVTAKMSFYVRETGGYLYCTKNERLNLAAALLGKSVYNRKERNGEDFNLEKHLEKIDEC